MRQERTKGPDRRAELVHMNVRMLGEDGLRRRGMEQIVRVSTMRDVDVVSIVTERMRQPVNVDRIAAETPRGVERRDVKEVQGPGPQSPVILQSQTRRNAGRISATAHWSNVSSESAVPC
jgi:hypothetical protein